MGIYEKPSKQVHRGFFYLDDSTVINSLSAVEAGKVDEVVAKVVSAKEGGLTGGVGFQGSKLEGGRKTNSALEEEIVRVRTRFSIFELWYQNLVESKAIGRFSGWAPDALKDVGPGHTVEVRARIEIIPLQALFRLYLWFAEQAKTQGTPFSQKGEELKKVKEAERTFNILLGDPETSAVLACATPVGGDGPKVFMPLQIQSLLGQLGELFGEYTIVGQVDHVLEAGEELPTLRLTRDAPPTPLELDTLKEVVGNFIAPAADMGVKITAADASVVGPALWLTPIAVFR